MKTGADPKQATYCTETVTRRDMCERADHICSLAQRLNDATAFVWSLAAAEESIMAGQGSNLETQMAVSSLMPFGIEKGMVNSFQTSMPCEVRYLD